MSHYDEVYKQADKLRDEVLELVRRSRNRLDFVERETNETLCGCNWEWTISTLIEFAYKIREKGLERERLLRSTRGL